tara:strand:- start:1279 stop:2385 length:1107 start_codon:yes stop_codon:yes gene_type:complete
MFAIRRWPRWLREEEEDALLRTAWEEARVLTGDEPCPVDAACECLGGTPGAPLDEAQVLSAPARLQWCLDQLPATTGVRSVLLVEGVDADGAVHAGERVLIVAPPLPEAEAAVTPPAQGEEEDAADAEEEGGGTCPVSAASSPTPVDVPSSPSRSPSYSPPRRAPTPRPPTPALPSPPLPATGAPSPFPVRWDAAATPGEEEKEDGGEDDTPAWLRTPSPVEQTPPPPAAPPTPDPATPPAHDGGARRVAEGGDAPAAAPVATPHACVTCVWYAGARVLALHGVLAPPLLEALAAQRVALPTADGGRVRAFRQAGGVCVGAYTLDVASYADGAYTATASSNRDALLPRRAGGDITRIHRARRDAFERR